MQQLRGREGARVRRAYRQASQDHGVAWNSRSYRPDDFEASDEVNMALSAATACLYGLVHAVVVSLGCAPGLGFIHTGHDRSFVYDVADLYKVEIAVPVAFKVVARGTEDLGADVRRAMRDAMHESKLLARCASDVHNLLGSDGESDHDFLVDVVELWDPRSAVPAGQNHEEVPW
jgi:CRISPR-associated protein Cas1